MSDPFANYPNNEMEEEGFATRLSKSLERTPTILERLFKGLPGVRGYVDKESRRNADYRLRQMIGDELESVRTTLFAVQNSLLRGGGLAHLDQIDRTITTITTLTDRIRTAAYGYAGLFAAVQIGESELDALHRFDVGLLNEVAKLEAAAEGLREGVGDGKGDRAALGGLIDQVAAAASELSALFDRRARAVESPEVLTDPTYAPNVRLPEGLDATDGGQTLDAPAAMTSATAPHTSDVVDIGGAAPDSSGDPSI